MKIAMSMVDWHSAGAGSTSVAVSCRVRAALPSNLHAVIASSRFSGISAKVIMRELTLPDWMSFPSGSSPATCGWVTPTP